jgi:hypothetical protein
MQADTGLFPADTVLVVYQLLEFGVPLVRLGGSFEVVSTAVLYDDDDDDDDLLLVSTENNCHVNSEHCKVGSVCLDGASGLWSLWSFWQPIIGQYYLANVLNAFGRNYGRGHKHTFYY